eukprot:PhF_6_TR20798/c0_g2_i1/m.29865
MHELMHLTDIKQRIATNSDVPDIAKSGTIMEMLCLHRLRKREMHAPGHDIPEDASDSSVELERLTTGVKKKLKKLKKLKQLREEAKNKKQEHLEKVFRGDTAEEKLNNQLKAGLDVLSKVPATIQSKEARTQVGKGWVPGNGGFNFELKASTGTNLEAPKAFDAGNGMTLATSRPQVHVDKESLGVSGSGIKSSDLPKRSASAAPAPTARKKSLDGENGGGGTKKAVSFSQDV